MARQFDFKKVAFIRMKLCALLHTAGDERIAKTMHAVTSGGRARAAGAMKAYEQFIGISEVKAAQENVTKVIVICRSSRFSLQKKEINIY